jgi:O-antigen polymerase
LYQLPWATGLAGLALTAPILIHTQTEYPLYHSGLHWITLILLLAFVDTHRSPPKAYAFPRIILPLSLAFLTPLLVIPFMVTGLQSLAVITQLEASKPRQYQRLLDVTNPAADLNRFQWHLWELRLNTALAKNDRQELTAYLAWSEKMSRGTPRAPLWVNQMIALRALGDFDGADAKLAEARYLFGDREDLRPFIDLDRGTRIEIR